MAKRILISVKDSIESETLVAVVADAARSAGSTIRVMAVKPLPENVVGDYGRVVAYASQEMARLEAEGERDLESITAGVSDVPIERVVRFGDPVTETLLEAETWNADLIAVAAGERSWRGRLSRRSEADAILRKSAVPVLIYRGR